MEQSRTISLSDDEAAFVETQVSQGHYADADAVLRAGLRILRRRQARTEALRAAIQVGLDDVEAGRVTTYAPGELLKRARQLLDRQG